MLKNIICALGIALVGSFQPAMAGTQADFTPADCGTARVCADVSVDPQVTLSAPYGNWVYLYVNGVVYKSAAMVQTVNFDTFPLYSDDGTQVLLTANFSTYRTCTHSGRAQHCTTHWALTDGFVVLP